MSLSSISNTTLSANQANHQKSETTVEQPEKRRVGLSSDNDIPKVSDNLTLSESVSIPNSEKTAGPKTLNTSSADNLLKQIMKAIMTQSKAAVSAQANLTPQVAATLLAGRG
jgi:hypothetical protein